MALSLTCNVSKLEFKYISVIKLFVNIFAAVKLMKNIIKISHIQTYDISGGSRMSAVNFVRPHLVEQPIFTFKVARYISLFIQNTRLPRFRSKI